MEHIKENIKTIPNFPKPGVMFRDITPVLQDFNLFQDVILEMGRLASIIDGEPATKVVGVESRGFIFGPAVALSIMAGFIPVRKSVGTASKLPRPVFSVICTLEYGEALLDIHKDSMMGGERVIIVDDVLATGGTAKATAELVEKCGGEVAGIIFLIELKDLGGREKLKGYHVESLVQF